MKMHWPTASVLALALQLGQVAGFAPRYEGAFSLISAPVVITTKKSSSLKQAYLNELSYPARVLTESSDRAHEYKGLFTIEKQKSLKSKPTNVSLAQLLSDLEINKSTKRVLSQLFADIEHLKEELLFMETQSKDEDEFRHIETLISKVWRHTETTCNSLFGSSSIIEDDTSRSQLSEFLKMEIGPLIKMSHSSLRCIQKPRGYAGDCHTIDMLYKNEPSGTSIVGEIIDCFALKATAAQAVRNRRVVIADTIQSLLQEHSNTKDPLHVMSMACGPAREIEDVFLNSNQDKFPNLQCHLVDLDDEALNLAKCWMDQIANFPHENVNLHQKNLLRLASRKDSIDMEPQDFIYSAGLVDYFKDLTIVLLLNYAYDNLKNGGKIMLGNFHHSNPTRGWMDTVLEWKLIHRSEEEMKDLFCRSKFAAPCEIIYDETGVQMMALGRKSS